MEIDSPLAVVPQNLSPVPTTAPPSRPSASIEEIVKTADEIDPASRKRTEEKADPDFYKKWKKIQKTKFVDESDLIARFPYPDELEDEDGIFMWGDYIVLSQDLVPNII